MMITAGAEVADRELGEVAEEAEEKAGARGGFEAGFTGGSFKRGPRKGFGKRAGHSGADEFLVAFPVDERGQEEAFAP